MKWLMRLITRTYLVGGLFRVEGAGLVPRTGALLVCPNHSSTADPPMVPAFLPRTDTWSMAKSEYFRKRWMSRVFTWYHAFPVVRHTADRRALRRSLEILRAGRALVIYPEGTRVPGGRLASPEPGAGFVALHSGALIQPVGLGGTDLCFPKGKLIPRRVEVSLRFGRPFRIAERRADGSRTRPHEAAEAIMVAIAELVPERQRGEFEDLEAWRRRVADLYRPA